MKKYLLICSFILVVISYTSYNAFLNSELQTLEIPKSKSLNSTIYTCYYNTWPNYDRNRINNLRNRKDDEFDSILYNYKVSRWLSRDPLEAKYPDLSPYHFAGNSPILLIDPDGKEIVIAFKDESGTAQQIVYTAGMAANTGNTFVDETINTLNAIHKGSTTGASIIDRAISTTRYSFTIQYTSAEGAVYQQDNVARKGTIGILPWNPLYADEMDFPGKEGSIYQSSGMTLIHEINHFLQQVSLLDQIESSEPADRPKAEEAYQFWLKSGTNKGKEGEALYEDMYENDKDIGSLAVEKQVSKDFGMGYREVYGYGKSTIKTSGGMSTEKMDNSAHRELSKKYDTENKKGAGKLPTN